MYLLAVSEPEIWERLEQASSVLGRAGAAASGLLFSSDPPCRSLGTWRAVDWLWVWVLGFSKWCSSIWVLFGWWCAGSIAGVVLWV